MVEDGAPPSGMATLRDLAHVAAVLHATSRRLAEAQEQAAALEGSRRELVAWVSHDLRAPLAAIQAMVEALEDAVVDDQGTTARYYRTMRRQADRLADLVDDLFELSRLETGELAIEFHSIPEHDVDLAFETAYRRDAARSAREERAHLGPLLSPRRVDEQYAYLNPHSAGDGSGVVVRLRRA